MSYDLDFYLKKNSTKTGKQIHRWVQENILAPRYESTDGNFWGNPHTGVYFSFEYNEPKESEDEEETEDGFPGFVSANISFNINYCRADFFGIEAFRVVDDILDQTELHIFNPQSGDELVGGSSNGALYKGWSEQNDR